MVCTGYVVAWFTNLHDFRARSLVERIFWSLPLSLAVSTIASVLIGKFLSLTAVVVFDWIALLLWLGLLIAEGRQLRRAGSKWNIGWRPLGGKALALVILWIVGAILSLVDIQKGQQLFMSVAMSDQSARINWTESIINTGIPPANPLYMAKYPAPMRNYYFWYVLCAAVARLSRLPVRAVLAASCAWSGLALGALIGLFLKHFLLVGDRLRQQFLISIGLLAVSGLDIFVSLCDIFWFHRPPPADLDLWSKDAVFSWFNTLLWAPHHVAALICCMFAFFLTCSEPRQEGKEARGIRFFLVACALSSGFGLSIYVTFAFFVVSVFWALDQLLRHRAHRQVLILGIGGLASFALLAPFVSTLASHTARIEGSRVFSFYVREMIAPDRLMAAGAIRSFVTVHPLLAQNAIKIVLLLPGYALELGFCLVVLAHFVYLCWKSPITLSAEQRSLIFFSCATLLLVTFVRSEVIRFNDFAFRGSLLAQFSLLLLGSGLVADWWRRSKKGEAPALTFKQPTIMFMQAVVLTLVFGATTTVCQALWMRFVTCLGEWNLPGAYIPETRSYSHNAYISSIGYSQLNAAIARDAVVQFNPHEKEPFWVAADQLGVAHQTVIAGDQPWCGAELGGDPRPCPAMAAALDRLFNGASAAEARATCDQYGMQYLIVRVYDPAWRNRDGWVWTLEPVVADPEFRALKCQ